MKNNKREITLDTLNLGLAKLTVSVELVAQTVEKLARSTANSFQDADTESKKRFDGVDKRLDGIDDRLDGIDGRLDGIDDRLDAVEVRLGHVEKEVLNVGNEVKGNKISFVSRYEFKTLVSRVSRVEEKQKIKK